MVDSINNKYNHYSNFRKLRNITIIYRENKNKKTSSRIKKKKKTFLQNHIVN